MENEQSAKDTMPLTCVECWNEDQLKLATLHARIKEGAEALARGDFIEVADAALDTTLDTLATR